MRSSDLYVQNSILHMCLRLNDRSAWSGMVSRAAAVHGVEGRRGQTPPFITMATMSRRGLRRERRARERRLPSQHQWRSRPGKSRFGEPPSRAGPGVEGDEADGRWSCCCLLGPSVSGIAPISDFNAMLNLDDPCVGRHDPCALALPCSCSRRPPPRKPEAGERMSDADADVDVGSSKGS
jgi:hypothetical protein